MNSYAIIGFEVAPEYPNIFTTQLLDTGFINHSHHEEATNAK